MTHPEELLAGYVDGALSAQDRAAVESHLGACSRCSREVALASGARSALRALAEAPAPSDVASRALREARGGSPAAGEDHGTPRWYRIGGIVGAAAAALLVFTLVLPHVGQDNSAGNDSALGKEAGAASDNSRATALAATAIEIRHTNFDDASLTALTASYQRDAAGDASAGGAQAPEATQAPAFGAQAQTDKALQCIIDSAPDEPGQLQSLIRARFEGTPAYLAIFMDGPGAGQPADAVTVWVFATDDCRILSYSSAQL